MMSSLFFLLLFFVLMLALACGSWLVVLVGVPAALLASWLVVEGLMPGDYPRC